LSQQRFDVDTCTAESKAHIVEEDALGPILFRGAAFKSERIRTLKIHVCEHEKTTMPGRFSGDPQRRIHPNA
jgi:hypothetical protein